MIYRMILSLNGKMLVYGLILFAVSWAGCKKEEEKQPPAGLLEEQVIIDILKDVYLAEAKVAGMGLTYDSSQKVFNLIEREILAKHGVEDSLYRISMSYYFEDAEDLSYIYEAVVDSLSLQERKLVQKDNPRD
jgi:hypothetical protein